MYRLQVKTHFDAAHYLKNYDGKCRNLHGHRWEVELVFEGKELNEINMLVDFSVVKKQLNKYLDAFCDHHCLNVELEEDNVTAEFLSKRIYDWAVEQCWGFDVNICRVTIWESPDCCVKYYGD